MQWLKTNQNNLRTSYLTPINSARKKAESAFYYSLYFKLLERKIDEYHILPKNQYNMDEKGFLISALIKARRIFSQRAFEAGRVDYMVQDGSREWITLVATICANGLYLSPSLIYLVISSNLQDFWLQDFKPNKYPCFFTLSPTGWTNNELGSMWLTKIFNRETKQKACQGREWRLLIVNGYSSYVNIKFLNYY